MSPLRREGDDVATLALSALVVPLTWLLLGWTWSRGIAGHDALAQDILIIREVAEGGGWSGLVFRPDLLGGFKGRAVLGPFPLFRLLAGLGLSPTAIAVVSAFAVQALLAFLACRTVADVAAAWSGRTRRLTWLERPGAIWLCAFAPVLGWRLGHGHLNLVVGLLPFAAALALVAAAAARTVSATLVTIAAAAMALGVLHSGQQIVVCGAVFGAPVLIGLWMSMGGAWCHLAAPILVVLGAALLAAPGFWGMLLHALSSDAPRALGAATVTYDYITATAGDWLTSIPWTIAALPTARAASLHHEVNYPAGPLLLLLAAVPWRRARALAVALGLSLAAVLILSMDVIPLSRALLTVVPPLKSFRVPQRAILPWLWAVSVLVIAALVHRGAAGAPVHEAPKGSRATRRRAARAPSRWPVWWQRYAMVLVVPLALALWLLPSTAREAGAWAVAAAAVTLPRWPATRALPAALALLVLGLGSVAAFRERLLPFPDAGALLATAGRIGDVVRGAQPDLASPLTRVRLGFTLREFTANTAFAAGLSSLEGYAVPTRRFAALVFALRAERYAPTAVFFTMAPDDRAWRVLRQLYNVTWEVPAPSSGRLTVSPLGPTAGPAWFSASLERPRDLPALAAELRAAGERLHERAVDVLWVDGSDTIAATVPATVRDTRCGAARVQRVHAPRRAREIVAMVTTSATCPFTLAMNFTEDLRAVAVFADGHQQSLTVFPGYSALASMIVPAGTAEVRVHVEPPRLPWPAAWAGLGVVGCVAAAALGIRLARQSPPAPGTPASITIRV